MEEMLKNWRKVLCRGQRNRIKKKVKRDKGF